MGFSHGSLGQSYMRLLRVLLVSTNSEGPGYSPAPR
jgi:hypothetical protein